MNIEIRNPAAPAEIVATYEPVPRTALDYLVARASAAQIEWACVPQPERGQIIGAFLDALEKDAADIANSITMEMGKPLSEALGEVAKAIGEGRATVARANAPLGEVLPSQVAGTIVQTIRRPRGVVLGINTWNFPFSTPIRKAIPALIYGNAILLKPSTLSPGALVRMQQAADATLPEGLLQVVIGGGALGQDLCEHPGIAAVSFTGSVGVGKKVAAAAVSHLAEISLELGGKNPVILNDCSDLDRALDQITAAAFAVCGQRCTAISRVIVHEDIADAVTKGLAERASAIVPVDGRTDGARMGPLASSTQLEEVDGFVTRALAEGAKAAAGGSKLDSPGGGWFYAPTVLCDVTRDMEVARDEVFGPVLSVIRYADIDEALSIANDVVFGLTSCLYSEQAPIVERFLAESESGMLHVNAGSFPENHVPFVGIKDSALGVGGSNGASTIQFYTTEHAIYRRPRA